MEPSSDTLEAQARESTYAVQESILTLITFVIIAFLVFLPNLSTREYVQLFCTLGATMLGVGWCFVSKVKWRTIATDRVARDIKEFTRDKSLD